MGSAVSSSRSQTSARVISLPSPILPINDVTPDQRESVSPIVRIEKKKDTMRSEDNDSRWQQLRQKLTACMIALNTATNFREFVTTREGNSALKFVCEASMINLPDDERQFVAETLSDLGLVQLWQREWKVLNDVSTL